MTDVLVMWKTKRGDSTIERVECTRATIASVWFMKKPFSGQRDFVETRAARRGYLVAYHASWEDARQHLLEQAALNVQSYRRLLALANGHYGNVKGLRKPANGAVVEA